MKSTNKFYGKSGTFFVLKAGDTYIKHSAVKSLGSK
jgi:hypothetical protein